MNTMKKFSNEHVWISLQDGVATVGITAHAQETLGDIVSTELPEAGSSTDMPKPRR